MLSSSGSSDSFVAVFSFLLYLDNHCSEITGEIDAMLEFSQQSQLSSALKPTFHGAHMAFPLCICALTCYTWFLLFLLDGVPIGLLYNKYSLHF